jgi:hypothetical protein
MQDELTKHGLKIYKTMRDRKHSIGEKIREIIIEIFIIVFAVTLSIWLHGWSEDRHEQKEVKEFLRGLKSDLTDDIRNIQENRKVIAKVDSNFDFAYHLDKGQVPDSILHHYFVFHLIITHLNNARYEGFKSSGKLGNIGNDSLKQDILVYYQQTAPNMSYDETFVNDLQQKLLDFEIDKSNISINEFLVTAKAKSLLQLLTNNLGNSLDDYDHTIALAKTIIGEIDKEILLH